MSENIYYSIGEFETLISQLDEYVLKYGQSDLREDIKEEALWDEIFADSIDMGPTSLCIDAWDFLEANQTVLSQHLIKEMELLLAVMVPFLSRTPDTSIENEGSFQFWPRYKLVGLTFGRIICPEEVIRLNDLKCVQTLHKPEIFHHIKTLSEKDTNYDFFHSVHFGLG